MNRIGIVAGVAAMFVAGSAASQSAPVAGERYEIIVSQESSVRGSNGSSSNSGGKNALLERVITVSDAGLELEFDLPAGTTAEQRAMVWQYPARIFRPTAGRMRVLNAAELEKRVDGWLAKAGMTRDMCGRWIFTWNAFRIECDPQSVVADLEAVDLRRIDLREGAGFRYPGGAGSGHLSRTTNGSGGSTYAAKLDADVDAVRRARAQDDVAVGEMMRQPVTFESALGERLKETVTGTIEITFDVDAAGNVIRRRVATNLATMKPDGVSETELKTITVERRRVP